MSNESKIEVKLPYFTEIYRMHWLAQPFAVLANFFLGAFYLVAMLLVWSAIAAVAVACFVVCLPFILLMDTFNWIGGLFRYRRR